MVCNLFTYFIIPIMLIAWMAMKVRYLSWLLNAHKYEWMTVHILPNHHPFIHRYTLIISAWCLHKGTSHHIYENRENVAPSISVYGSKSLQISLYVFCIVYNRENRHSVTLCCSLNLIRPYFVLLCFIKLR